MEAYNFVLALARPWMFMSSSLSYLPPTLLQLIRSRKWSALFSWNRLQSAWFARFWSWAGRQIAVGNGTLVTALLQGQVAGGHVLEDCEIKKSVPPVSGTVLELGPGIGIWEPMLGQIVMSANHGNDSAQDSSGITKIYGIEPNPAVHETLQQQVDASGLHDVYEIIPTGLESILISGNMSKESVDCVVSVLCLCGIPDPEQNIRQLYDMLKPGGRIYVFEHVKCQPHWFLSPYQWFINLFWPQIIGGCSLLRDTGRYLREAGPWTSVDLHPPEGTPWYQLVPHIVGVLVK